MFPLLRASRSSSHGLRHGQATDGWMRMIAPPRDTASVFFHRSACWSSPSSRPGHDLEICTLWKRPCDQENTWSETVIAPRRFRSRPPAAFTSEDDGRLCRSARLPDMCERPSQMERPPAAWAIPRSRFTMSNSPLRGFCPAQRISFPRRVVAPGLFLSL